MACRCQAPAKMQCPNCLKLGLAKEVSVFCSQECFKVSASQGFRTSWVHHTAVRASPRPARTTAPTCRTPIPPSHTIHTHRPTPTHTHTRAPTPPLLPPSQAAWPEHKQVHNPPAAKDAWLYCMKRGRARSDVMPDFAWTGPLRPYRISPRREVRGRPGWALGGPRDLPCRGPAQRPWVAVPGAGWGGQSAGATQCVRGRRREAHGGRV